VPRLQREHLDQLKAKVQKLEDEVTLAKSLADHYYRKASSRRTIIREQEAKLNQVQAVLHELCEVKILKDVQGDTPEYRKRQPKAWAEAFACFPEYENG
jgi:hypothetical protein